MIIVLKNGRAGKTRTQTPSKEIVKRLGSKGYLLEPSSLDALEQHAQEVSRARPETIAIWGGDGTITTTLTALVAAYQGQPLPPLCLLPGGTMNVVARSIGVQGRPHEVLARLSDPHAPPRIIRRPGIQVGAQVGFLFGIGLQANFLALIYQGDRSGSRRTLSVLAKSAVSAFSGTSTARGLFTPFRAKLTVDGHDWPDGPWVNVSAGGVEGVGLGFKPYIRAAEREGCFHLIAHNLSATGMVMELPNVWLGQGMKKVKQDIAREVTIELERPMPYSIDGETYAPRTNFSLRGGLDLQLIVP